MGLAIRSQGVPETEPGGVDDREPRPSDGAVGVLGWDQGLEFLGNFTP